MKPLSESVALVTGAGRGIGREIALRLARDGAKVAAVARTTSELESVASDATGAGSVHPFPADISLAGNIESVVKAIRKKLGPVDILVNNAGMFLDKPILDTSVEEWRRIFEVNAVAPFLLVRAVLPEMIQRGAGRIINVCSTASHKGYLHQSAYVASKHALLGFTRTLAGETRGTGIRVHAVSPGGVNTKLVAGRKDVDISQYMDPAEIAEAVVFLARMNGTAAVDELVIRRNGSMPFS